MIYLHYSYKLREAYSLGHEVHYEPPQSGGGVLQLAGVIVRTACM